MTTIATELPHETIWNLTNALIASTCLSAVAALGIADHVADEPVDVAALAARSGTDPDALNRVLRVLVDHGIFGRRAGGYAHTEASRLLRNDHPMSMRAFASINGLPLFANTYPQLAHSLRTGEPAVNLVAPGGMWAYLDTHPAEAQAFGQAMTARAAADQRAVLDAYDFTAFGCVADIGGGHGHLIRALLDANPAMRGILFDLPEVIAAQDNPHERLARRAGDFFVDPLPQADAYILMEVIHDWADAEAAAILGAIRRACATGATVLIIEDVLDDEHADVRGHVLDVIMLAVTGGRERTPAELGVLLARTGFQLRRVIDTGGRMAVAEAVAVPTPPSERS